MNRSIGRSTEAVQRFAQGGFHVAYEKRVDLDALRKKRIARADEQRKKAGLDALLVWKDENCRYLTNLRPQLIAGKTTALNGALLIEGKAPILFCSGGERDRVDRTMPWIEEVHTIPIIEERALVEGMVDKILGPVLREHGLSDGKLGLDEANTVFVKAKPILFSLRPCRRNFQSSLSKTATRRCSRRA
jgi:Xaa-Pro aminopeptidase